MLGWILLGHGSAMLAQKAEPGPGKCRPAPERGGANARQPLRGASAHGSLDHAGTPADPDLKPLRGDPRFTALLAFANNRPSTPAKH
jgi:hypothetical protein